MNGGKGDRAQVPHDRHNGDVTVATLWLVFYLIVIGTAVSLLAAPHAVEVAAR